MRTVLLLVTMAVLIVVGGIAAACNVNPKDVNPAADEVACVYDGSDSGGHHFKRMVRPGDHYTADDNDVIVSIPTSFRFYNMTTTSGHDTLAPTHLIAEAANQTAVWTEGTIQFRFDTRGNKPCEWFANHGRRNAKGGKDLGFNVRGQGAQAEAGWFHFLQEKFGETAKQTAKDASGGFTWSQIVYGSDPAVANYPGRNDRLSPTVAYGVHFGEVFTKYLDFNLGGEYFCGTQEHDPTDECPPLYFQLSEAHPVDASLTQAHDRVQQQQTLLEAAQQEAALNAKHRQQLIEDARAQRRVLEIQAEQAALKARTDPDFQKCKALASLGLDCEGHRAAVYVTGIGKVR